MEADNRKRNLLRGIAVMAASWDDPDELSELVVPAILAPEADGSDPEAATVMGLMSLCTVLLVKREQETGISGEDQLKQIALQFQ